MAGLQQRNDRYRVIFRYHGKQHTLNLGKVSEEEAEAKSAQVDYLLMRLKQGLIELPPGTDIVKFVNHDGKMPATAERTPGRKATALATVRDRYLATYAQAIEKNTLRTAKTHFRHLTATLGAQFPVAQLKPPDLQRHIDRRARASISPVTIRKELATLGTAWNWAEQTGSIAGSFPNKVLVYPKADEKPPFQTREEIERQIRRSGLNEEAQKGTAQVAVKLCSKAVGRISGLLSFRFKCVGSRWWCTHRVRVQLRLSRGSRAAECYRMTWRVRKLKVSCLPVSRLRKDVTPGIDDYAFFAAAARSSRPISP